MMRVLASRLYFVYLIGCSETRTDSARLMRLFSTALDTTLTAFAAERRRACYTASASRLQLSIHISRLQGALSSKPAGLPLLLSIDGTDRRTDGRTPDRYMYLPCCAYYESSLSNPTATPNTDINP